MNATTATTISTSRNGVIQTLLCVGAGMPEFRNFIYFINLYLGISRGLLYLYTGWIVCCWSSDEKVVSVEGSGAFYFVRWEKQ